MVGNPGQRNDEAQLIIEQQPLDANKTYFLDPCGIVSFFSEATILRASVLVPALPHLNPSSDTPMLRCPVTVTVATRVPCPCASTPEAVATFRCLSRARPRQRSRPVSTGNNIGARQRESRASPMRSPGAGLLRRDFSDDRDLGEKRTSSYANTSQAKPVPCSIRHSEAAKPPSNKGGPRDRNASNDIAAFNRTAHNVPAGEQ
jgi:hypothetical protein